MLLNTWNAIRKKHDPLFNKSMVINKLHLLMTQLLLYLIYEEQYA